MLESQRLGLSLHDHLLIGFYQYSNKIESFVTSWKFWHLAEPQPIGGSMWNMRNIFHFQKLCNPSKGDNIFWLFFAKFSYISIFRYFAFRYPVYLSLNYRVSSGYCVLSEKFACDGISNSIDKFYSQYDSRFSVLACELLVFWIDNSS